MQRLVSACAATLLLTGCQSAPEPIEPSPSATPPASHAPPAASAAKPPTLPEIAKRNDETGAANFVVYWVRAFNFAALTGETAEMERFGSRCKVCMGYAADFKAMPRKKRLGGEAWTLSGFSVQKSSDGFDVEATVSALSESKRYPLTFVLKRDRPFQLVHIFERP